MNFVWFISGIVLLLAGFTGIVKVGKLKDENLQRALLGVPIFAALLGAVVLGFSSVGAWAVLIFLGVIVFALRTTQRHEQQLNEKKRSM